VRDGWSFAAWKDADGVELLPENIEAGETYYADWVDKVPPVLEVVCSKNTAQYQEVVIRAHDIASRIFGYYVGMDNPEEQEVLYTETADREFLVEIKEPGKYYFSAKDTAGNVSTESIEFVRISFAGIDEETAIKNMIDKQGDKLELPSAKHKGHTY